MSSPDFFQSAMRQLFLSLLDLLTKQPHDLRALQIKCDGLVNRSSEIYRSTIRPEDGDLLTAKATFIRVWEDITEEATICEATDMLPHRFRKVTAFANAMCHNSKIATIAKVDRFLKEDGRAGKGVEMHDCNIHDVTEAIYTIERLGKSKVLGDMEGEAPPKDSAGSTPSQPSGGAAPSSGPSSSTPSS